MYLEQFKLKELPFRLSPDPDFLYLSKAHARAKAYMESTIWFADGFVVITGEIGCGKTTLIETFLKELQQDVVVAQVNQTQVSSIEFLQFVLAQFGFKPFRMKKAELLATLNDFLVEQYRAGKKLVLIIDEAQNLTSTVLEEVRLLSGIETTKEKVLRIILAGQPELNDKLDAPDLEQLTQRIRLRFHLPALSSTEMRAYILHRLEVAGSQGREIFAPDCFDLLYRYTGGVPRLVNTLCDSALLATANDSRDTVLREDIVAVVGELQWSEYASRSGTRLLRVDANDVNASTEERKVVSENNKIALARILLASGGRTVAERSLSPGRLIIGRTAANDLQVESRFVSRHHCQIVTSQHSCVIEDLNSTNGIFLHSKRVRSHNLNDGDVITIGQHELLYIDERSLVQRVPGDQQSSSMPQGSAAGGPQEASADAEADADADAGS